MINNPYKTTSDSYYFIDGKLVMHSKAEYNFESFDDGLGDDIWIICIFKYISLINNYYCFYIWIMSEYIIYSEFYKINIY